jgi:hypothetical protein
MDIENSAIAVLIVRWGPLVTGWGSWKARCQPLWRSIRATSPKRKRVVSPPEGKSRKKKEEDAVYWDEEEEIESGVMTDGYRR